MKPSFVFPALLGFVFAAGCAGPGIKNPETTRASSSAKPNSQSSLQVPPLPPPPKPVGNYRPYSISGNLIFINQIALKDGKIQHPGTIGKRVTIEQAKAATRQATLNVISVLKSALNGDLNRVEQCVQLTGFFNTAANFQDHAEIMNASSDLVQRFFGERGVHARAAMGAASLPMGSPVEIQAIFEIRPE